ncbi:hypothetical protein K2173_014862 [Erythroxylum novogranatense]|uniref:poly(A)-specific ribonuclease n=1 Tax=Erythroxylum novogranatense TaxID=1862640 RepID=A0AAV8THL7_9ROSI|nr:hypothetical protein K2173_014862 [Erythroxylum novogranatense]
MNSTVIREVWNGNFEEELVMLDAALYRFHVISVDTEFPGCILKTRRNETDDVRYKHLKFNVENSKLIQLGITLSDELGVVFVTWEFNFQFDVEEDKHSPDSIHFLKLCGIDFCRLKKEGIVMERFSPSFSHILRKHRNAQWVTFHGLYDLAHVLQAVTLLPESVQEFAALVRLVFVSVVDVKYMARFCRGLQNGELGLQKLGECLAIARLGAAHNAGSDSLLTSLVYANMKLTLGINPSNYEGCLYGLDITTQDLEEVSLLPSSVPLPCFSPDIN